MCICDKLRFHLFNRTSNKHINNITCKIGCVTKIMIKFGIFYSNILTITKTNSWKKMRTFHGDTKLKCIIIYLNTYWWWYTHIDFLSGFSSRRKKVFSFFGFFFFFYFSFLLGFVVYINTLTKHTLVEKANKVKKKTYKKL